MFRRCLNNTKSVLWSTQYVAKWVLAGAGVGGAVGAGLGALFGQLIADGENRSDACDQLIQYGISLGCEWSAPDPYMSQLQTVCEKKLTCPDDATRGKVLSYRPADSHDEDAYTIAGAMVLGGTLAGVGAIVGVFYAVGSHDAAKAKARRTGWLREAGGSKENKEEKKEIEIKSIETRISVARHPASLFVPPPPVDISEMSSQVDAAPVEIDAAPVEVDAVPVLRTVTIR